MCTPFSMSNILAICAQSRLSHLEQNLKQAMACISKNRNSVLLTEDSQQSLTPKMTHPARHHLFYFFLGHWSGRAVGWSDSNETFLPVVC